MPFLEAQFTGKKSGAEYLAALKKEPRIIKTHLPLELMKDNIDKMPNMKIIQTITLSSFLFSHAKNDP